MGFGLGFLFDPLKNLNMGTGLFGGPKGPIGAEAPGGLLRAGTESPLQGGGATPLTKAGMEGPPPSVQSSLALPPSDAIGQSRGLSIGAAPPIESSAALHPPITPPPVGITSPSTSPQYTPTPVQPGEGAGSLPKGPLAPAIATPPPAQAAPAPAGGGAAGPVPTTQLGQGSALGKLADVGKALGSAGGQSAAGAMSGHAPSGMGGDPAAGSRQGAAALMESIMKANAPSPIGGVPGLPPGLMQRVRR